MQPLLCSRNFVFLTLLQRLFLSSGHPDAPAVPSKPLIQHLCVLACVCGQSRGGSSKTELCLQPDRSCQLGTARLPGPPRERDFSYTRRCAQPRPPLPVPALRTFPVVPAEIHGRGGHQGYRPAAALPSRPSLSWEPLGASTGPVRPHKSRPPPAWHGPPSLVTAVLQVGAGGEFHAVSLELERVGEDLPIPLVCERWQGWHRHSCVPCTAAPRQNPAQKPAACAK